MHLNELTSKLLQNESILGETIHLKFLHIFVIKFLKWINKIIYKFDEYSKYPIMINNLMDLDFCIKLFFFRIYGYFKRLEYKTRSHGALDEIDKRILVFNCLYLSKYFIEEKALKYISYEKINILNESLIIKEFIIVGNESFGQNIKIIEKCFSYNKITTSYLSITGVKDYFYTRKLMDKYRSFTFFMIIEAEEVQKICEELYNIKNDFGLNLFLIIYLKEADTLINKIPFLNGYFMPFYIAYNENDIIKYINSQKYLSSASNFLDASTPIANILNKIKFPKSWNENENNIVDRLSVEDGWELVDFVPKEIFKKNILGKIGDEEMMLIDKLKLDIYNIYKENNIESLFFRTYCKFFFYQIIPEFCYFTDNIFIKHFCYAYSLDEGKNSFYYIMNKDLRSGDSSKIQKYLDIIANMNDIVEKGFAKSFKGEVYRGTKIPKDFIDNKIVKDKVLTNLSFWSSSKSLKIAEKFLKGGNKNILFIINTKGKNIDIDLEHISKFENEKEVLFLPYSKFLIKSKIKKIFNNKEIYEVKLEGLDDEHERGNINLVPASREEIYALLSKNNIEL